WARARPWRAGVPTRRRLHRAQSRSTLRAPNRRNSSLAASRTAGIPTVGRAPVGIGAVMAPMPASAGAAATAGTAGSCRDTTAPRGSHTRIASGRSLKRRPAVGRPPASQRRSDGAWAPPLRLSRRLLLILAGEKRGRKLCRITTLVRRTRMVFAGAQVRFHDLAIEVPGRVAEHRHHHGQAEEERQRAQYQQ